jgi:hypothetical protein
MFDDYNPSLDDLLHLLSLSHIFDFPRVRKRAIREIDEGDFKAELDPVRKLALAEKYGIDHWIAPCCEALCHRPRGLTIAEAHMLGIEMANHVWTIREYARSTCARKTWQQADTVAWNFTMFDRAPVKEIVQKVLTSTSPLPSPVVTTNVVPLPEAGAPPTISPPAVMGITVGHAPRSEFTFKAAWPISLKKPRKGKKPKLF